MRQYDQCPDDSESRTLMCDLLQRFDDISFKMWQTTDKCTLMNHSAPVEEYTDMFVCAVEKSCSHSFLATSQSDFLRRYKIELKHDTALILLALAEKFKFVAQDEVQGFHSTNLQCTLHHIFVYYKFNGEIYHKSLCILSYDTLHDVNMIQEIRRLVIENLKYELPHISSS